MSTTVITNVVTNPSGAPMVGVAVRVTLVTATSGSYPGLTGAESITAPETVITDGTGAWSMALTPNSEITQPTGTFYVVSEGGYLSAIVVPAGGGPYNLRDVQVGTPPTPTTGYVVAPATIGVQANGTAVGTRPTLNVIAGANVTVTAADNPTSSRVDVTIAATGGGGGGAVTSVNGQTGTVVLAASDVGAPPTTRLVTAGTGLTGGGSLAADRTLAVAYGTTSGTAAQGNDARITGALQAANNLSDLATPATARTNLGLGTAATQATSAFDAAGAASAAQTAAIAASAQRASNLSDLANASTARTNLGLGGAAVLAVGTTTGTVAAGDDTRITGALQRSTATTKGDLLVATAGGTIARLGVGTTGQVLTADSTQPTGTKWAAAGGGSSLVVRGAFVTTGDTNLSVGAGSWTLLPGFSLAIPAAVGDWVELSIGCMIQAASFLDVAVVVGGVAVRYASNNTSTPAVEGAPWLYPQPNSFRTTSPPFGFTVGSGDLDGGNVVFGLAANGTAGTLYSSANYPFRWIAKNFGAAS